MTPTFVLPFFFVFFSPAKKKKIQNFSSKKKPLSKDRDKKARCCLEHRTERPRIIGADLSLSLSLSLLLLLLLLLLLGRRREEEGEEGKNAHQIGRRGRL